MYEFIDTLKIIGVNPYLDVPQKILEQIFIDSGKDKGPIPVKRIILAKEYKQTLVKFQGSWRLHINTSMLKNSPKRIGETIQISIAYDPEPRTIAMHPKLKEALQQCPEAQERFDTLSPSRQHEIIRYISRLKSEDSIERNVQRAIDYLLGKKSFVGRNVMS